MIELFKALLLGAVQGITEFLPVSSTGHLILFEHVLGVSQETYGLAFDAALHLGTLIAIVWFFKDVWRKLFFTMVRLVQSSLLHKNVPVNKDEKKLIFLLAVGTVPAVILGLLLEDVVNSVFRSPLVVAAALILFSFVLLYVEKVGRKYKDAQVLKITDALIVGFAQAIALIPGVSRSGITIASGMWRGLKREQAAYFAFLLSAPIVAGAGGKQIFDVFGEFLNQSLSTLDLMFFLVGIISAAIFGYLTIKYFLRYIAKHSLYPFIVYRIVLGCIIIFTALF